MQGKNSEGPWDPPWLKRTIRSIRDTLGIRQAQIAAWAEVGQPQVSRWVAGTSRPGYEPIRRIQRALARQALASSSEVADTLTDLIRELGEASGYPGGPLDPAPSDSGLAPSGPVSPLESVLAEVAEEARGHLTGLPGSDADREDVERQLGEYLRSQATIFVMSKVAEATQRTQRHNT
ncbi:hypothetical protein GCM10009799_20350 [Nocardiopsis rhodophaea]|uniref:HTH cro/C1-type domain-containing protein n=1 Tax=Nocardiopsis rhodophaea TaxID=280238 RepID=A0ABN2SXA1_9ACTN